MEKAASQLMQDLEAVLAQAAVTKYHSLGGLDNRRFPRTVTEAEESKIKVLVLFEGPRPGLWTAAFLLCAHMAFLRYIQVEFNFENEQE